MPGQEESKRGLGGLKQVSVHDGEMENEGEKSSSKRSHKFTGKQIKISQANDDSAVDK
jgi:hypothetical protein